MRQDQSCTEEAVEFRIPPADRVNTADLTFDLHPIAFLDHLLELKAQSADEIL